MDMTRHVTCCWTLRIGGDIRRRVLFFGKRELRKKQCVNTVSLMGLLLNGMFQHNRQPLVLEKL